MTANTALARNLVTTRLPNPVGIKSFNRLGSEVSGVDQSGITGKVHVADFVSFARERDLQRDTASREHRDGRGNLADKRACRDRSHHARAARERLRLYPAFVGAYVDRVLVTHDDKVDVCAAVRLQLGM